MKTILRLALFAVTSLSILKADVLRLRDGSVLIGQFVAGSQNEIWFHREVQGTMVYPLSQVDTLAFGSVMIRPSSFSIHQDSGKASPIRLTVAGFTRLRQIDLHGGGARQVRLSFEGFLPPGRPMHRILTLENLDPFKNPGRV